MVHRRPPAGGEPTARGGDRPDRVLAAAGRHGAGQHRSLSGRGLQQGGRLLGVGVGRHGHHAREGEAGPPRRCGSRSRREGRGPPSRRSRRRWGPGSRPPARRLADPLHRRVDPRHDPVDEPSGVTVAHATSASDSASAGVSVHDRSGDAAAPVHVQSASGRTPPSAKAVLRRVKGARSPVGLDRRHRRRAGGGDLRVSRRQGPTVGRRARRHGHRPRGGDHEDGETAAAHGHSVDQPGGSLVPRGLPASYPLGTRWMTDPATSGPCSPRRRTPRSSWSTWPTPPCTSATPTWRTRSTSSRTA